MTKPKYEPLQSGNKTCKRCNVEKHVLEFNVDRALEGGRHSKCRQCKAELMAIENADPVLAEKRRESKRRSKKKCAKQNLYGSNRRALKKLAKPTWVTVKDIAPFYKLSRDRRKETGVDFHVDHKVPLVGICIVTGDHVVCGLHTPDNLWVITAAENLVKSNKFIEELAYV